jgi:phospholipase A-2-activating protein
MYTVAEKFLLKNDLPTTYLDQIVKFLETNTGATALGSSNASDPFTGGSSYRSTGNESAPSEAQYRDPFTGGGAYTSASQGPSSAASNHQEGQGSASVAFTPIRLPQYFTTINAEAIKKKIAEFGNLAEAQQVSRHGSLALLSP